MASETEAPSLRGKSVIASVFAGIQRQIDRGNDLGADREDLRKTAGIYDRTALWQKRVLEGIRLAADRKGDLGDRRERSSLELFGGGRGREAEHAVLIAYVYLTQEDRGIYIIEVTVLEGGHAQSLAVLPKERDRLACRMDKAAILKGDTLGGGEKKHLRFAARDEGCALDLHLIAFFHRKEGLCAAALLERYAEDGDRGVFCATEHARGKNGEIFSVLRSVLIAFAKHDAARNTDLASAPRRVDMIANRKERMTRCFDPCTADRGIKIEPMHANVDRGTFSACKAQRVTVQVKIILCVFRFDFCAAVRVDHAKRLHGDIRIKLYARADGKRGHQSLEIKYVGIGICVVLNPALGFYGKKYLFIDVLYLEGIAPSDHIQRDRRRRKLRAIRAGEHPLLFRENVESTVRIGIRLLCRSDRLPHSIGNGLSARQSNRRRVVYHGIGHAG